MYCYIDIIEHYDSGPSHRRTEYEFEVKLLNVMCGFLKNNFCYSDRLNSI